MDLIPEDDRNEYSCPASPRHLSVAVDKFNYRQVLDQMTYWICTFWILNFEVSVHVYKYSYIKFTQRVRYNNIRHKTLNLLIRTEWQGSKKVLSSHPGQQNLYVQVKFHTHLPNGQGRKKVDCQLNMIKSKFSLDSLRVSKIWQKCLSQGQAVIHFFFSMMSSWTIRFKF